MMHGFVEHCHIESERALHLPQSLQIVRMCPAQLLGEGPVSMRTLFEAPGMTEPKPLFAIRELRWWVASGLGEALRKTFRRLEPALRLSMFGVSSHVC